MPTKDELIQQLREIAGRKPEKKSERMQILITPSMVETLKAVSEETGLSKNEIVNLALANFLKVDSDS